MKNSYELEGRLGEKYSRILAHDKKEIDNPDRYHPDRLGYLDRMKTIVSIIKRRFPVPAQIKIGDFACAQGNISLILAESGYKVFAIDMDPSYIEYSKMKYEEGDIEWVVGNVDRLDFPEGTLNAAIAGEFVEHCVYPEEIMEKVFKCVSPGGLVILTTPNGARIRNSLPAFRDILHEEKRRELSERQFGPAEEDHLFLFKLEEIECILSGKAEIEEKCYLGGTILINKYSHPFLKLFPLKFIERGVRMLSKVPVINRKTFNNICVVFRKKIC